MVASMRRPIEDPIPHLAWTSITTVEVRRRPGTSGHVRLYGGGMIQIPESGLEMDATASGAGGLNSGTSAPAPGWLYVYVYDNAGSAAVTADEIGPLSGGPSGISAWRYVGPIYFDDASVEIQGFSLRDGRFVFHGNRKAAGEWRIVSAVSGTSSWHIERNIFSTGQVPETAWEMSVGHSGDDDSGLGPVWSMAADLSMPTYSLPSDGSAAYYFRCMEKEASSGGRSVRTREWPITNGDTYAYDNGTGDGDYRLLWFYDRMLMR